MTPDDREREDALTPAEAAVLTLLEILRADAPRPEHSTTDAVMRTARWQYGVRGALVLLGDMTAALTQGVALVFGVQAEPSSRRERP